MPTDGKLRICLYTRHTSAVFNPLQNGVAILESQLTLACKFDRKSRAQVHTKPKGLNHVQGSNMVMQASVDIWTFVGSMLHHCIDLPAEPQGMQFIYTDRVTRKFNMTI
ncbi:hypothetical protein BaRGS_00013731 [Batillaria attramentaria]|uniref:Uncharacterized protein n=1 Tax=Batillaria attramentaria TaxID=370345 RepID=A0ABD0L732_9CAEN